MVEILLDNLIFCIGISVYGGGDRIINSEFDILLLYIQKPNDKIGHFCRHIDFETIISSR